VLYQVHSFWSSLSVSLGVAAGPPPFTRIINVRAPRMLFRPRVYLMILPMCEGVHPVGLAIVVKLGRRNWLVVVELSW
jgi:hypothetical protein